MELFIMKMALIIGGFFMGFILCAVMVANDRRKNEKENEITVLPPESQADIGDALCNAGEMLNNGEFKYLSGYITVQDMGFGIVSIYGDLSLQAVQIDEP